MQKWEMVYSVFVLGTVNGEAELPCKGQVSKLSIISNPCSFMEID